jgi:hypothetical protein
METRGPYQAQVGCDVELRDYLGKHGLAPRDIASVMEEIRRTADRKARCTLDT